MSIGLVVEEFPGSSDRFVFERAAVYGCADVHVYSRRRGERQLCDERVATTLLPAEAKDSSSRQRRYARTALLAGRAILRPKAAAPGLAALRRTATIDCVPFLSSTAQGFEFESPRTAYRYAAIGSLERPITVWFSSDDRAWFNQLAADQRARVVETLSAAATCATSSTPTQADFSDLIELTVPESDVDASREDAANRSRAPLFLDGPADHRAGLEFTLLALAQLQDLDLEAVVAGGGPLLRYLRYTAGVLGLDERVRWLAPVSFAAYEKQVTASKAVLSSSLCSDETAASRLARRHGVPVIKTIGLGYDIEGLAAQLRAQLEPQVAP